MIGAEKIDDKSTEWKRINMRNVSHLMGVEFIHDLYNRHEPKINSIRFRHTITTWKDGIVNSYAPVKEWGRLRELLGSQYYNLNPLILKNTKILYAGKRKFFHQFMKKLEKTSLSSLSNEDIVALLVNFQSIVLGELYVVNFVQIEHSLNYAIKKVISEVKSTESEQAELFIQLIQTKKTLTAQHERWQLYKIARKWKLLKKIFLFNEIKARQDVKSHCDKYQYLYSAYGEEPKSFNDFWLSFNEYLNNKLMPPTRFFIPNLLTAESKKILKKLNNKKLNVLVPLLVTGGSFRDTNKAHLGQSLKFRFMILEEIAKRNLETREKLNYYLLSEIADLLNHDKQVSKDEIYSRKNNGVVFTRYEDFKIQTNSEPIVNSWESQKILLGECASEGECTGICKIVLTKNDADKVNPGDVMVAIGTDFDLIEAMYRSSAVITEEGGILSHAAVVCREINKPCCINVKDATKILKDGLKVKIYAGRGEVIIQQD